MTLAAVIAGLSVAAALEVFREHRPLGWLLWIPFLGALPLVLSVLLVWGGVVALRRGSMLPAMIGSSMVLLSSIVAGANSQWAEPGLSFQADRCGPDVCSISLAAAGLPTWNVQRWVALGAGLLAVVSLCSSAMAVGRTTGALVILAVVAIDTATGYASWQHAETSARATRSTCERFLAATHPSPHPSRPQAFDACRNPQREATSIGP